MTAQPFALLYDYRCPFARTVHEHVLAARRAGMDLDVTFEPFTLHQGHIATGDPDVWDDPAYDGALLSLEVSVAVRDKFPYLFDELHGALFDARHVGGVSLTTRHQLTEIMERTGLDVEKVFAVVDGGEPRQVIAERWRHFHDDLDVFGVPTFVIDDADAVFVRLMSGPDRENPAASIPVIERLLDLILNESDLNEFKHTQVNR